MKKLSVYLIGEIIGKYSTVVEVTEGLLSNSSRMPMYGLGVVGMLAARTGEQKKIESYIMPRMNDIDINDFKECLNAEMQGIFLLGFYEGKEPKSVKSLIEKTGLTHQEIADKLGISRNTVTRWSRGAVEPSEESKYEIEKISFRFE